MKKICKVGGQIKSNCDLIKIYLEDACTKYSFAEVNNNKRTFNAVILHFEEGSLRIHVIRLCSPNNELSGMKLVQ